jgi:hypothetical protein
MPPVKRNNQIFIVRFLSLLVTLAASLAPVRNSVEASYDTLHGRASITLAGGENGLEAIELDPFVQSVVNGQSDQVVGVYVPGVLALPVTQQPAGQPGYVADVPDLATQFSLADPYNTIGLLAHNTQAGIRFSELDKDQIVIIVYGDGRLEHYEVSGIRKFRAFSPNSVHSDFEDLASPGSLLSASQVFEQIYSPGEQVVFQTCIYADGNYSWGRLFVTAEPVETFPVNMQKFERIFQLFEQNN